MNDSLKNIFILIPEPNTYEFRGVGGGALLIDIGVKWYVNKLSAKIFPLKNHHLSKDQQEREDITKANMRKANYDWSHCKYQIRWKC